MEGEDDDGGPKIWKCGIKMSTKATEKFRGLISLAVTTGTLEFVGNDGKELSWPLEAFSRHRKNPKLPMIQLQFDASAVVKTKLREKVRDTFEAELIVDFAEEAANILRDFESALLEGRKKWVEILAAEKETQDRKTRQKYVDLYLSLLANLKRDKEEAVEAEHYSRENQRSISRQAALESNPGLALLHKEMVETRSVVSEEVFWQKHSETLAASTPLPAAEETFYFPPNRSAELSFEAVEPLLAESQLIRLKYEELVGKAQLTESEFWSRLFNSKFYATLMGQSTAGMIDEPYFDSPNFVEPSPYDDVSDVMAPESAVSHIMAPDIDFGSTDAVEKPGFGLRAPSEMGGPNRTTRSKRRVLTLSERLNRHASRALKSKAEMRSYFTGTQEPTDEEVHAPPAATESLGVLAALMSLESAFEGRSDVPSLKVRESMAADRLKALNARLNFDDLRCTDTLIDKNMSTDVPVEKESGPQKQLLIIPGACEINREMYATQLASTFRDYKPDINPASNDLAAKCCFVKFTTALKSTGKEAREALLDEALHSSELVATFNKVADLQSQAKELLYHAYTDDGETDTEKLFNALVDVKEAFTRLTRLEIDASINPRLTAMINTRTLCQPVLHCIDHALKHLASTRPST